MVEKLFGRKMMNLIINPKHLAELKIVFVFACIFTPVNGQQNANGESIRIQNRYHYIVVGGGTAGSVLASRLSEERNVKVLLLEAGRSDIDYPKMAVLETPRLWSKVFSLPSVLWKYETVPQRHIFTESESHKVPVFAGNILGGSSSINGMGYYRGSRADFDFWSHRGASGWSYNEVLPYFIKIENNQIPELRNSSLHGNDGPVTITSVNLRGHEDIVGLIRNGTKDIDLHEKNCNEENPIGFCKVQANIRSGVRMSTSKAYLHTNLGRQNLDVVTEAFVTKIDISRRNRRAFGARFISKGKKYKVRVKREIIVSSGTIGSAKLLLLSGIGPREHLRELGIREVVDLPVGQGLKDHVALGMNIKANITSLQNQDLIKPEVTAEYMFRRSGFYANQAVLLSLFMDTIVQPRFNWPDIQVTITDGLKYNRPSEESFKTDTQRGPEGYTSYLVALHTKSLGTVKLQSTDPFSEPAIDPRYLERIEDVDQLVKGLKRIRELVNTRAYKAVNASLILQSSKCPNNDTFSDEYLECLIRAKSISFNHIVSTCKMGSIEDKTTVVDPYLRVKGIKNIRVADASIMPEIPSSNPHAIVIMIAEKAAEMIKEQWKKGQ